ncbi:MAG TPA: dipeptidase [Bellilinea sp.]|nr:dipeptidase [Bellilinea sp.]
MTPRTKAIEFAERQEDKTVNELIDFLTIPSVSTDPEHKKDMQKAAEWLEGKLKSLNMDAVHIIPSPLHPFVFASKKSKNVNAPTVLFYGHYDVQPPDPMDLWQSEPFKPEVRGDHLYARGSSDMKGQVVACLKAVQSVLEVGDLPINVKFIFEGEEEIGSPSLIPFLRENKDLLKADITLNPDSGMLSPDEPTLTYALRGLSYFELRVYGPSHDLHSGIYGGAVHNPAIVLSKLIAGMHDKNAHITLPGFYDKVRKLSAKERRQLAKLPIVDSRLIDQTGSPAMYGEKGFSSVERLGARPSLDVNGLYSGFIGKGSKTIIPSYAMAKISMRLVPDQKASEIREMLVKYIESNIPATVRWELDQFGIGNPSISDVNHPAAKAMAKAQKQVWGVNPLYKREGGSVPIVGHMQEELGMDSVLTGFGLPGDNIHSPNERVHLPTLQKGVLALINFIYNYAEKPGK